MVFKSGFRLYFQRIWVSDATYRAYLMCLQAWLAANCQQLLPANLPPTHATWADICDT